MGFIAPTAFCKAMIAKIRLRLISVASTRKAPMATRISESIPPAVRAPTRMGIGRRATKPLLFKMSAGIPGPGCPVTGCGVANAVANGSIPLPVFNQALARILYQEERFGLLGCNNATTDCKNPGGMGSDRSGLAPLSEGPKTGPPELGTKNGDAAISERVAEEGAVLLKNDNETLPIKANDLKRGIAISGPGAEYLVANPNNEGSAGFSDRNAINLLQQLRALSGEPSAFTYTPANSPTGQPALCSILSSVSSQNAAPATPPGTTCNPQNGLQRSSGKTTDSLTNDRVDAKVDYSTSAGQLQGERYIGGMAGFMFRSLILTSSAFNTVPRSRTPMFTLLWTTA